MKALTDFVRICAKHILAVVLIAGAYSFARLPVLSNSERAVLASRFSFAKSTLPDMPGFTPKSLRAVHPSLARIASWISAVGAAVALNDLDGDGLANDLIEVDPRIDQVIVAPAPNTPARYAPFVLNPAPLPYNPDTMAPMGCQPGDFNEDGLTDILVYYWGRAPVLFLRKSTGANAPAPLSAGLYERCELVSSSERWYTNAVTQADLDGDGHIDLIIGNYFPDGSRILDAGADKADRDPQSMQHSMSRAFNGGRNRFLRFNRIINQGAGGATPIPQFEEADAHLDDEVTHGWTLAVGAADLDGDLLPEVYFANDFGPDRLLHNLSTPGELRFQLLAGQKTLTTPNSKVVGRDSFKGMGVSFGDLNGDGLLDIYVSNIAAEYALEESHFAFLSTGKTDRMRQGVAPYVDCSEEMGLSRSGWGWDCRLADFDNDGVLEALQATGFLKGETNRWPELHELAMGNDQLLSHPGSWPQFQPGADLCGQGHNPFFIRASDGRYYDLAVELGLDDRQVSRGIAVADVDGDGRLDFAVANQWEVSRFYHNVSNDAGSFLGLRLLLPLQKEKATTLISGLAGLGQAKRGRPAIGAFATVYLPDGRRLVAEVDGGSGHSGKCSTDIHFGLGAVPPDTSLKIELHWRNPDGEVARQTLQLKPGWHTILLGS